MTYQFVLGIAVGFVGFLAGWLFGSIAIEHYIFSQTYTMIDRDQREFRKIIYVKGIWVEQVKP